MGHTVRCRHVYLFWRAPFFPPLCILIDFNYIVFLIDFVWFEIADYCCRILHTPTPSIHQFYSQWTGTKSKAARPTSCRSTPCYTGTWESGAGCKESEQKGMKLQTPLVCIAACLWSFLRQRFGSIFTKRRSQWKQGLVWEIYQSGCRTRVMGVVWLLVCLLQEGRRGTKQWITCTQIIFYQG